MGSSESKQKYTGEWGVANMVRGNTGGAIYATGRNKESIKIVRRCYICGKMSETKSTEYKSEPPRRTVVFHE